MHLALFPLVPRYYRCCLPQELLLQCSHIPQVPQSFSLPVACRSMCHNHLQWELGRTAAWLAGKIRLPFWPGSRSSGTEGQCGHTAGTECETERTVWTWTLWTHLVCCCWEDIRQLFSSVTSPKLRCRLKLSMKLFYLHTHPVCLWSHLAPLHCAGLESSSSHWTPWSCRCDAWSHIRSLCLPTVQPVGASGGKGKKTEYVQAGSLSPSVWVNR